MSRRRVVITGLGVVSSLGNRIDEVWEKLVAGQSGVSTIENFDTSEFAVHIGAEIKGFEPTEWMSPKEAKGYDRFTQFGVAAAAECVKDSGLDLSNEDPYRAGVIVGSGIGGISEIETQHQKLLNRGPSRVSPFLVPKMMGNAVSGVISIRHGFQGINFVPVSACASGSNAVGSALRAIQYGDADIILTGGSEAAMTPIGLAGFCSARALSKRNEDPTRASRPFDKDRDGFVMSEGAGMLMFEEYEHAKARNANIYAEVLGCGMTGDAHHITAPHPAGAGATRAMQMTLEDAKIDAEQVDYVNAHGTSTELNDKIETAAIKAVFGDHARKLAISSTKSMLGHMLGASGGLELVVAAMSVQKGVMHPTINYETPDPDCDLDYVPNEAREQTIRAAISNSFGFGGHNACVAIGKV